jgi:predicted nucleic acid-binding protein
MDTPVPKIYLDTSVPSHLFDTEPEQRTVDTWRLWAAITAGKYEACVSPKVLKEIQETREPKRTKILKEIQAAGIKNLKKAPSVWRLANEYIRAGVLTNSNHADCIHMAYATVHKCDILVSWNFQHLVKTETTDRTKVVNKQTKHSEILILSPTMLIERGTTI